MAAVHGESLVENQVIAADSKFSPVFDNCYVM